MNDTRAKKYLMPNGKYIIFAYDEYGIGKITVEAMDRLIEMIGGKEVSNDSNV